MGAKAPSLSKMTCKGCGNGKAHWIRANLYGERCDGCSPGESFPSMRLSTDVPFNGTEQLKSFLKHKEEKGLIPGNLKGNMKQAVARFEKEDLMRRKGLRPNGMSEREYDDKCGELTLNEDGSTNRPDLRWEPVADLPTEMTEVRMPEGVSP